MAGKTAKQQKKQKRKTPRKSFLFRLSMCAFVLYAVVMLVDMQVSLAGKKIEVQELSAKVKDQYSANKELKRQLSNGTDEEYIERVARDQLDFVYPDETIYQVGQH